ncbi:MAG TPA: hypothetical protein VNU64_09010 [Burkholderiales bacterium]|nr:hypothetical protein [Burkholderiales bacterium]
MVAIAGAYRWSSHAGNSGATEDGMLTPHVEYTALGDIGEELKSRLIAAGERVEPGKSGPKADAAAQVQPASMDLFGELAP